MIFWYSVRINKKLKFCKTPKIFSPKNVCFFNYKLLVRRLDGAAMTNSPPAGDILLQDHKHSSLPSQITHLAPSSFIYLQPAAAVDSNNNL